MNKLDISIKDLIYNQKRLTFLVGAGSSIEKPSCLAAGKEMKEAIINFGCEQKYADDILKLENLRFEILVEIFQNHFDDDLKIIDYYANCDKPNLQHYFFAHMLMKGNYLMTTNFDCLFELALINLGYPKEKIIPVITQNDFKNYSIPSLLYKKGEIPIFKLHGTPKNIISKEITRNSLITTIKALGKNKKGISIFQIEPFKQETLKNLLVDRTLVVIGYSGLDDFDIIPSIKDMLIYNKIIWLKHKSNDYGKDIIYQIEKNDSYPNSDDYYVDNLLLSIKTLNKTIQVIKVEANISRLIKELINFKVKTDPEDYNVDLHDYIRKNIKTPSNIKKKYFSHKIYLDLSEFKKALRPTKELYVLAMISENKFYQWVSLNSQAKIFSNLDKNDQAIECYQKAIEIADFIKDDMAKATSLGSLATIYEDKGEYSKAYEFYKIILDIYKEHDNQPGLEYIYHNLSILYYRQEKYNLAFKYSQKALEISEELGDFRKKAHILIDQGNILLKYKKFREAFKKYVEASNIAEKLSMWKVLVVSFTSIGLVFHYLGDLYKAIENYKKAIDIQKERGFKSDMSSTYLNLGGIFEKIKDFNNALIYYNKALKIVKILGLDKGFTAEKIKEAISRISLQRINRNKLIL